MLLSHEKKFLFVHIPKTGGKSFRHHVGEHCNRHSRSLASRAMRKIENIARGDSDVNGNSWRRMNLDRLPHLSLFRAEQAGLSLATLSGYRVIAVVRYPVAWHYSTYQYVLRYHREGVYASFYPETALGNFGDYLKWRADLGAVPQATMVVDSGAVLRLTNYCRLEKLETEMPILLQELGLSYEGFPRLNAAPKGTGQEKLERRWSDEILSLCYDAFREDYECFGYDAEGLVLDEKPVTAAKELPTLKARINQLSATQFDPWVVYDLRREVATAPETLSCA